MNIITMSLITNVDPGRSQTLLDWDPSYWSGDVGYDAPFALDGNSTEYVAHTMYPESGVGSFVPTFFNDWYNRIHFVPPNLALGNLLSSQTREVILWNAYLTPVDVTSFGTVNADAISVTQPTATPFVARPLSTSTYIVSVSASGPPAIAAALNWTIEGVDYSIPITGRRTVIWPFAPNWKNSVDETFEWLTYIETSFNRTEQRFAGRDDARRILEYTAQITGSHTQLFESFMFGWADRLFAVPLWHEITNLTAPVAAGDIVLPVGATSGLSFIADGLVALFTDPENYEAMEIESLGANSITLKKGLDLSWPAGTRVYPVMLARLDHNNTSGWIAEDKLTLPVRFLGSPEETDPNIPDVAPALTYEGVEVFAQGTNWGRPMSVEYATNYDVIDSDKGKFTLRQRANWPMITKGHEWLLKTRSEARDLLAFFGRRRGRLTPAWIPTGTADFTMLEPAVMTDSILTVKHSEYGQFVNQHPARRHVLIQLRGGTNILREIGGYSNLGGGRASLSLTAPVGSTFDPGDVRRISFIGLYRGGSDSVTFSWKTAEVAVLQSSFILTRPAAP